MAFTAGRTIWTALLAKAAAPSVYAWKTDGLRVRDPEDVEVKLRPAIFLVVEDRDYQRPAYNLPPVVWMHGRFVIYTDFTGIDPANPAAPPDPNAENKIPALDEEDIRDAVEAALAPDPGDEVQTLGNLVGAVIIDGHSERATEVDLTGKGVITMPVRVLRNR